MFTPHELDRALEGGKRLRVVLVDESNERLSHHPFRRAVVSRPVPAPSPLHLVLPDEAQSVKGLRQAKRSGGSLPTLWGRQERGARQDDRLDEIWVSGPQGHSHTPA